MTGARLTMAHHLDERRPLLRGFCMDLGCLPRRRRRKKVNHYERLIQIIYTKPEAYPPDFLLGFSSTCDKRTDDGAGSTEGQTAYSRSRQSGSRLINRTVVNFQIYTKDLAYLDLESSRGTMHHHDPGVSGNSDM